MKLTVQNPCQPVKTSRGDLVAENPAFALKTAVGVADTIDIESSCASNGCGGGGGIYN